MEPQVLVVVMLLSLLVSNSLATKEEVIASARAGTNLGMNHFSASRVMVGEGGGENVAWTECRKLYEESDDRLRRWRGDGDLFDVKTWVSAALTSHRTCLDGLAERSVPVPEIARNVTSLLAGALARSAVLREDKRKNEHQRPQRQHWNSTAGKMQLLERWHPQTGQVDMVVSQDGSSEYRTINQAVDAVASRKKLQSQKHRRIVVYVKAGVYKENVEIGRDVNNVMFVGDGIGRTIVTGRRSVPDGYTTYGSATFGVSGDGFWARDITFENTGGAKKHQAVALRVNSDQSVFYRCGIVGYQDTLFAHSGRQFYRECHIHGTIDFIFGNAIAVLQHCLIVVRRPMQHQANMITAQGRDDPHDITGLSIHECRVVPVRDLVSGTCNTFLGRPWKRYSRTIVMRTDLDGLVHKKGWAEWHGRFALDTLYYGEYMNTGAGSGTDGRVSWGGFHVFGRPDEAEPFTVGRFIQGDRWLPETGVPFSSGM